MRWADELASASSVSLPTLKTVICSFNKSYDIPSSYFMDSRISRKSNYWSFTDLKKLPLQLFVSDSLTSNTDIVMISNEQEFKRLSAGKYSNNPQAIVLMRGKGFEFIETHNNYFLFYCEHNAFIEFIRFWIGDFIVPFYLKNISEIFKNISNWNGMDYETANIKCNMLTQNDPYLKLEIPSKIELNSLESFKLIKFPENIRCLVYTTNLDIAILGESCVIKPVNEGTVSIVAYVKGHKEISVSQNVHIYKYCKVQRIQMSVSKNVIMEGEQFQIKSSFYPSNAQNISHAQWDISPNGCVQMLSPGIFLAKKNGNCKITQTIDSIKESITISVYSKPKSIRMDHDVLSIKLGNCNEKIHTTVFPVNCQGGKIKYRISDARILDFDKNNGQIYPKEEGETIITAMLLDENDCIIDNHQCRIIIEPPKDVITPDGALVLFIVSIIGTVVLFDTPLKYIFGVLAIIGGIWLVFQKN